MKRRVRCFHEDFEKTKPYTVMDAGIRVIEVKQVVGTVDKCGELDDRFRYIKRRDNAERSRRYRLEQAANRYQFFPPIDVYLYRGKYYVVDGNRRVALAKALEMEFIDAHVMEYIHKSNGNSISGAIFRRRFENETELRNIRLTVELGYSTLLEEIKRIPGEHMAEKVRKWYSEAYLPACSHIKESQLPSFYPALTEGDIFVLIVRFYREFMGGVPTEDFHVLISGFMFAHTIPELRIWRKYPFRLIGKLITHREERPIFPGE